MGRKMNNGIIFSIVINGKNTMEGHFLYRQLSNCLNSLRKVNKEIDVKVYYSSEDGLPKNHLTYFPEDSKTEFIPFENNPSSSWYPTFLNGFSKVIEHRWINAFKGLEDFNFDNILYMDTDTQFFRDPEELFLKYGNSEFIWTREDTCEELMKALKIYPGMNDGITLISKNILKHKDLCLESIKKYINYTLDKYLSILSKENHQHLNWVIIQFAAFDYFYQRNLHSYFDKDDVLLHIEDKKNTHIVHHYFTGNSSQFLPKWLGGEK
jgi:hypothetical protein